MRRDALELRFLGPVVARRDGTPLALRTRKALALLAYLAAEGGTHRRGELAGLLWPDSDERKARTTLRSALSDLRSALGTDDGTQAEYLLVDRDLLGLRTEADVDLDLRVLESAYELARDSTGIIPTDHEQRRKRIERLRNGAEAYRGEFLEGFHLDDAPEFDYWAGLERERWRTRLATVLDGLSRMLLDSGEAREAAAVADRWVAHDPQSGPAYERLMRCRYALGDPAGALRVHEQFHSATGGGSDGATNAPELAALAARIRAEERGGSARRRPPLEPGRVSRSGSGDFRQAPRSPLVGRAHEFGVLAEEHSLASSGRARAVALVGEAGIGKTRLADEFLLWAVAEGADVLRGDYPGHSRSVPYGSLISAIRYRLERERAPDDLLEDTWLSELSRLLPEIRDRYPDLEPPSADQATAKSRLFEAVVRLLEALARRTPVILFVDDLHWVDVATLDLLLYAAARLADDGSAVLLLVAMRDEEMDRIADLEGWLLAAERAMPLRRVDLGNLNGDDTVRMLLSLTDDGGEREHSARDVEAFGHRLYAETGGQPFFLVETIKALLDQGALPVGSDAGAGVKAWSVADGEQALNGLQTPGVRGLVRERLLRVGPAASDLLAAAAVLGDGSSFDLLRQVAGLPEREGLSALDEALRGRLLRESLLWSGAGRGGYSFVHDKVREVVYTEAGEARRRVFHRRAMEVLAEQGAPDAELARHALGAWETEAAFRHSVAAAEVALALFAVEDAREHLVRARSLLDEGASGAPGRLGTAGQRLQLYGGLGRVHEVMREWAEAQAAYERMLEEARRADDREAEWATLHRLAALGIDEGSVTRAERGGEFYRELRRTRNHGSEEGSRRDGRSPGQGASESFAWSLSTARGRETEALGLARAMHRDDLVVQSLAALGVLEAHSGRWERALSAAEEGIAICSRTGDKATEGELLGLVARSLTMTGEARTAARRMGNHPGLTGALGDREIHRADLFNMAIALTETGDYDDALAMAREGVAAARSVGYAPRLMLNLLTLGDTYRTLFRLREAGDIYREMAEVIFPPEYHALTHAKLCAVAALAADWTTAYDEAVLAAGLRDEVPVQSTAALHFHLDVEALVHGGDQDLAREQLARFGTATGENRRLRLAHLRALAVLGRHDGDETAALAHIQAARGLAQEIGLPGELWQIEALIGAIQAGLGNEAEAQSSRGRAAAIVNRLAAGIRDPALRQRYVSAAAAHREPHGTPSP